MNYYVFSALVNFFTSFTVAVLVAKKNRFKDPVSRSFCFFAFSVAAWSLAYAFWQGSDDEISAANYCNILTLASVWIPSTFMYFIVHLTKTANYERFRTISFLPPIIFSLLMLVDGMMVANLTRKMSFNYWPNPGFAYHIFIAYFFLITVIAHYIMFKAYKNTKSTKLKQQIIYVFAGTLIGFIGGSTNYLLWYNVQVAPIGNILVSFYVATVAYSIIRHQLMDIEILVKRATVYTILFASTYGIFVSMSFLSQLYIIPMLRLDSAYQNIPIILVIILVLRPLENWLTNATNKYLFQKPYDYKELLKIFTNEVLTVLDFEKVSRNTVAGLDNIIKLESCSVLLKNPENHSYYLTASINLPADTPSISPDALLIRKVEENHEILQLSNLLHNQDIDPRLIESIIELKAELIIPIIYSRENIGLVCLGRKKSGEDFNKEDLDVLSSLAGTVGIAVSNARLYAQLSQTQAEAAQSEKMAVIGTLASGINHEICNPLGIVRGHCEVFLLNFKDGLYKNIDKDKLLDQVSKTYEKIIAQIDRATGITKRLSAFAKPNKLFKKEPIDAGHEVEEVLQILAHEMRIHNIEVKNELPPNYPKIMCDKKQIQEVMFNIIRNAAQAMKGNGKIQIDGARNGVRAWINIKDTGPGITPEQQAKIFHPFFTTKQPGEGTGLGLYIVKQIVEKNDGTIELNSTPGEGATFKLTFKIAEEECLKS